MPDTPRTLRDVLEEIAKGEGAFSRDQLTHATNCVERAKELAAEGLALIGCQGWVVYTAEDVEAGCRAQLGCEGAPPSLWDEMSEDEQEAWLFKLRLGITAAGGVVADESTEIVSDRVVVELTRVIPNDDATTCTELRRGDKLYIVRAKEE